MICPNCKNSIPIKTAGGATCQNCNLYIWDLAYLNGSLTHMNVEKFFKTCTLLWKIANDKVISCIFFSDTTNRIFNSPQFELNFIPEFDITEDRLKKMVNFS